MLESDFGFLATTREPWIVACVDPTEQIVSRIQAINGDERRVMVVVLDGRRMRALDGLYDELAAKLQFPDYFGRNYDAINDCLTDLDWLEFDAIVLIVLSPEEMLQRESRRRLIVLLDIIWDASADWSEVQSYQGIPDRPARGFHTILVENKGDDYRAGFAHHIPVVRCLA